MNIYSDFDFDLLTGTYSIQYSVCYYIINDSIIWSLSGGDNNRKALKYFENHKNRLTIVVITCGNVNRRYTATI